MVLILASNSPRRRQILALGGWDFRVQAAEVDEQVLPGEDPRQYVLRLAECKARTVAQGALAGSYVIAADTTVVDHNAQEPGGHLAKVLVKPLGTEDAIEMLRQLRGRAHQVLTGLVVLKLNENAVTMASEVVTTEVVMRAYSDQEIDAYVATGDPLDKAGAYAIQHAEFHPVERLHGCYANVVGLPLCVLTRMLADLDLPPESELARRYLAAAPADLCAVAPLVMDGKKN